MLLAASSSTAGPVFWILSPGDLVAIGIAIIANLVTVVVTNNVQKKEDARALADRTAHDASEKRAEEWKRAAAKRDRIHAHFAGIVFAANTLEAMADPMRAIPDRLKSQEALEHFKNTLDEIMRTLASAASNLTVEGMTEQVDAINQIVKKFFDFRQRLYLMNVDGEPANNFDEKR
jgi:hypothetical protein